MLHEKYLATSTGKLYGDHYFVSPKVSTMTTNYMPYYYSVSPPPIFYNSFSLQWSPY